MKPPTIGPMTACLSVAAFHIAFAQTDSLRAPHNDLVLSLGATQIEQLDATASPLRFGGQGYDATARYTRSSGLYTLSASLDGGPSRLSPLASPTHITERVTAGELRIAIRRSLAESTPAARLSVGADVATMLSVTTHHYDDPTASVSDFVIGSITIGPSVAWRQSIGAGTGTIQFGVPLVGFVDHPYSDTRTATTLIDARFATASTIRGVSASVSYAPALSRRVGVEYAYRLRTLQYADVQPLRSVSQAISVGLVTRLGQNSR